MLKISLFQVLALNYYCLVLGLNMRILLKNFPQREKMEEKNGLKQAYQMRLKNLTDTYVWFQL